MAELTVQEAAQAGVALTLNSAAAGGDEFSNDGRTIIIAENGDGSSTTITVTSEATLAGLAVSDLEVAVAAGATKAIGPFPVNVFNDSDGNVNLSYSSVTSLTVAVLKVA